MAPLRIPTSYDDTDAERAEKLRLGEENAVLKARLAALRKETEEIEERKASEDLSKLAEWDRQHSLLWYRKIELCQRQAKLEAQIKERMRASWQVAGVRERTETSTKTCKTSARQANPQAEVQREDQKVPVAAAPKAEMRQSKKKNRRDKRR